MQAETRHFRLSFLKRRQPSPFLPSSGFSYLPIIPPVAGGPVPEAVQSYTSNIIIGYHDVYKAPGGF